MSDAQEFDKNSRIIRKLCQYFKVVGIVEVFLFVLILRASGVGFLGILILGFSPGLITVLSANSIFNKNKERRGYFGAIWNMLKYNPISYFMFLFILGDFLAVGNSIASYVIILIALLGIISFVCGIILAVKISKHNRILSNL